MSRIQHSIIVLYVAVCVVGSGVLAGCGPQDVGHKEGGAQMSNTPASVVGSTSALDTKDLVSRLEPLMTITTPVSSMTWSPDGRYIATVGSNGLSSSPIVLWDITTGASLLEIENEKPISNIAWSPDGRTLAVASDERDNNAIVELYDAHTGQKMNTFTGFAPQVGRPTKLQWSPDGGTIAVTVSANQLRLLEALTGEERYQDSGFPRRFVNGIAWSPDSRTFASTDAELEYSTNALGLYDATTGNLIESITSATSDYRGDLTWSPDGSTLAVVVFKIHLYDTKSRKKRFTIDSDVYSASWSSDGRILASSDRGHGQGFLPEGYGVIRLWDPSTGKELRNLSDDNDIRGEVVWSPVGHNMAIASGGLVVWGIR